MSTVIVNKAEIEMPEERTTEPLAEAVNKTEVAKAFSAAAVEYDTFAHIQHRMAHDLLNRLPSAAVTSVLDIGCGTGYCLPELQKQYPNAQVEGMDLAQGMIQYAQTIHPDFHFFCGDAEALPVADERYDLLYSSFAIQWCQDLSQVFKEAYRVLKPGGWFAVNTLAEGTLLELKKAWETVDGYQHVNEFLTALEIQKIVSRSPFNVEQFSAHTEIEYYETLRALTDSLKRVGAHNMTSGRAKGLTTARSVKAFRQAMETFRTEQGLPARYEVVTLVLRK